MKHFLISAFLFFGLWANAQTIVPNIPGTSVPAGFAYQAVARQASGAPYVNTALTVQFTVLQGSATGSAQLVESHAVTTNANGLFTTVVGTGTPGTGGNLQNFSDIDWGKGKYFLKVDLVNGASTTNISTTQLLSVPYAQVAGKAPWSDYAVYIDTLRQGDPLVQYSGPAGSRPAPLIRQFGGYTAAQKGNNIVKNGNQITLQPGSYHITYSSFSANCYRFQANLEDVNATPGAPALIRGTYGYSYPLNGSPAAGALSLGESVISITQSTTVRLMNYIEGNGNPQGTSGSYGSISGNANDLGSGFQHNNGQIFIQKID